MRPASDSILSAVERTDVSEDRLTEVLACVAQVNAGLAAVLVTMAGLESYPGERYAVGTQRVTPSGRRVDMEIATYQGLARTRLVWIEAKDGAAYQPNQLSDYAKEVRDPVYGEPAHGRVLTIIPPKMRPELDTRRGADRWVTKTWSDVALAADRLGRAWGRKAGKHRWNQAAMAPAAPSQWRYLAELVRRIEEKGYARMQPLAPEDVITAQRSVALSRTLQELVRAVSKEVVALEQTKLRRPSGGFHGIRGGCYQVLEATTDRWFSDKERFGNAYPELLYHHDDDWTADRLGAPAFWAGITFNQISDSTRHRLSDEGWQAELPDDIRVGGTGRLMRVGRTKYLSELIVAGATLDEQAQALIIWAGKTFADVTDHRVAPAPTMPSG